MANPCQEMAGAEFRRPLHSDVAGGAGGAAAVEHAIHQQLDAAPGAIPAPLLIFVGAVSGLLLMVDWAIRSRRAL